MRMIAAVALALSVMCGSSQGQESSGNAIFNAGFNVGAVQVFSRLCGLSISRSFEIVTYAVMSNLNEEIARGIVDGGATAKRLHTEHGCEFALLKFGPGGTQVTGALLPKAPAAAPAEPASIPATPALPAPSPSPSSKDQGNTKAIPAKPKPNAAITVREYLSSSEPERIAILRRIVGRNAEEVSTMGSCIRGYGPKHDLISAIYGCVGN